MAKAGRLAGAAAEGDGQRRGPGSAGEAPAGRLLEIGGRTAGRSAGIVASGLGRVARVERPAS